MKVKSIQYSESKESISQIGLRSWKRVGIEVELSPKDDVADGISYAKKIVKESMVDKKPVIQSDPVDRRVGLLISDIESCQSINDLTSFELVVKENDQLQSAYDNKLKQFQ